MNPSQNRPTLAITMGDPAGIGPEVAVRAFSDRRIYRECRPLLIGDGSVIRTTLEGLRLKSRLNPVAGPALASFLPGRIDLLDLQNVKISRLRKGEVSPMAGAAAYAYLLRAIDLAMAGEVDGIVTCPISKAALHRAGIRFPGHTEILAERTGTKEFGMMLVAGDLRVVLVTIHASLKEAISQINGKRILRAVRLAHGAGLMLGMEKPRIAVTGLNPHAGEGGIFGREEIEIIKPAIRRARRAGYDAQGPFPADTVFYRALAGEFDFVVPMTHDQGLIPIKTLGFGGGVNVTLGLPIIRTSVDHGTGFDRAWQFRADPGSLKEAIHLAARMARIKKAPSKKPQ